MHDIGKNIVKVVLESYGYDVIDLGKDVPPEAVVEAYFKHMAGAIVFKLFCAKRRRLVFQAFFYTIVKVRPRNMRRGLFQAYGGGNRAFGAYDDDRKEYGRNDCRFEMCGVQVPRVRWRSRSQRGNRPKNRRRERERRNRREKRQKKCNKFFHKFSPYVFIPHQ